MMDTFPFIRCDVLKENFIRKKFIPFLIKLLQCALLDL